MKNHQDIFKWTGEFSSPGEENRFLTEAWTNQAKQIRFTAFIGGIIYFLAILANYYNLGFCPEFTIIFLFRLLVLLTGLVTARLTFRNRRDTMMEAAIVTFVVMVCIGELVEMVYMGAGKDYYTPAMIPIILLYYLFLPNPLALTVKVALVLSLVHTLSLFYYVHVPLIHLTTTVLFFVAVNGLGIYFVRRTNQLQRREFHAMRRLQKAMEAKDVFLATMSHEFRTPLNAIIGLTALTLHDGLPPDRTENLLTIKDSADHLKELIDDVLDLAKIENDQMVIEQTDLDLRRLLTGIERTMNYDARKKGLILDVQIEEQAPAVLKGDRVRLRQVLVNLIGNAIKFTETGSVTVRVEVEAGNRDDGLIPLCFSVIDTGVGIAREKQEAVFDRFSQADDSTTRKYGGTGLGLTISRRLVELMGGRIWVESEPGRGSCFAFRLAFEPGDPEAFVEEETAARVFRSIEPAARTLKILLADDNPAGAKMMTRFLSLTGHTPVIATNGRQVLTLLSEEPFDLVLLDIEMPEMDGLEAARRIRAGEAGPQNRDIKIIALTAHVLAIFQERAADAGIERFLTKPIDFNKMNQVIAGLFPGSVAASPTLLDQVRAAHKSLLPELLETLRNLSRQASEADDRGDYELLRRTGHTIKGTAAGFRVQAIREVGEQIEKRGKERAPLGGLTDCLNGLLDEMEAALEIKPV